MENNLTEPRKIMVWYRNDLRIHDHQPLIEACQKSQFVLPVFCFDPRQFQSTAYHTLKTGYFRTRFLIESIQDLRASFQALGANLLVRVGYTEEILLELAQKYGIQKVFAFKEVATEEIALADIVEEKLWKKGISMDLYLGNTLYNKEDLPFPIKDIPDTFTLFRKRVERDTFIRECFPAPKVVQVPTDIEWGNIPDIKEFPVQEEAWDDRSVMEFRGGETEGLKQLKEYIWDRELIKTYKITRNGLIGRDYSSKLSAWLSLGCLSPRRVYSEIRLFEKEKISNDSTQWLIFELLWRDYFRFVFKKYGSKLFLEKGLKQKGPESSKIMEELYLEKWKKGETGIPFIDANMREMNATGFMSNRGRQNVASFLVHDLKIKWTLGAAYFEEKLVDYNPSSNWGNWAYIAGVGNDPRENRYFNILKQSFDYDPKGEYVKRWCPELQNLPPYLIHQPYVMNQEQKELYNVYPGNTYPLPIVEFKKFEQQV
jgi:deoxyribodipyrimidine photo-lyase